LAYFCWNKAVESGGAHNAGMFFNLIPVFSSLLAVLILKEVFTLFHLVGMVLIFSGICLFTFYERLVVVPRGIRGSDRT
jgi:drug/metabolite transporter (DMT)-like permease